MILFSKPDDFSKFPINLRFSFEELSSVTNKFIFKSRKLFNAFLHEIIKELIVLKVYSIFGFSKILDLFWS